jgi:uncharacterized RmlC-like cupin family protein
MMLPGITRSAEPVEATAWDILGQTYVPKSVCESSFSWHATLPAGSFVPPHIHLTQDEFIYLLEGRLEFLMDGKAAKAEPGDLIRLPMKIPHGIFNRTDSTVKCLFWVSPTGKMFELFQKLHKVPDPVEVARISGEHDIPFLP